MDALQHVPVPAPVPAVPLVMEARGLVMAPVTALIRRPEEIPR